MGLPAKECKRALEAEKGKEIDSPHQTPRKEYNFACTLTPAQGDLYWTSNLLSVK